MSKPFLRVLGQYDQPLAPVPTTPCLDQLQRLLGCQANPPAAFSGNAEPDLTRRSRRDYL